MRVAGVICECNPLHAGHQYLFSCARAAGADAVIAVMSTHFTQRGEAAIADPYVRARLLLQCGVNAVFALPFPYCSAPAEQFGAAGVRLLSGLGADELWFGSECGSLEPLMAAAQACETPAFLEAYRAETRAGVGTAAAYATCLRRLLGGSAPVAPNDLLALSYLRALKRLDRPMRPFTVRRVGAGYREQSATQAQAPSAMALRTLWERQGLQALSPYLTDDARLLLEAEVQAGRAPALSARLDAVLLAHLRTTLPQTLCAAPALGGGIGRRLSELAGREATLAEVLCHAGTHCPTSRLRRGLLFSVTGVTEEDLLAPPAYASLLAADPVGCRVLSGLRGGLLPVVTKRAQLPETPEAKRQTLLAERGVGLWTLCLPAPVPPAVLLRRSATVIPDNNKDQKEK